MGDYYYWMIRIKKKKFKFNDIYCICFITNKCFTDIFEGMDGYLKNKA